MNDEAEQPLNRSKRLVAVFRRHPSLWVSLVYVAASTIGMLYAWNYLRLFGINVFDYAQIGDFLLASLKEPFTWVIVAIAFVSVIADNAFSRAVQRRTSSRVFKWYGSRRYRMLNYIGGIVLILVFMHVYAVNKHNNVLAGDAREVSILLADASRPKRMVMLGTTGQFIFLYDVDSARVDIHPHENVGTISFHLDISD